jgi:hypothetical protein
LQLTGLPKQLATRKLEAIKLQENFYAVSKPCHTAADSIFGLFAIVCSKRRSDRNG